MRKEVDTILEAEAIVAPLMAEDKWAITVVQNLDGKYVIQWTEHKMYTAPDGKEYRDEVWTNVDGDMMLVQDMEAEYAKNALRTLLREERLAQVAMDNLFDEITAQLTGGELSDPGTFTMPESDKKILH